jgi:sugar lactone lactonase YvrE
MRRFLTLVCLLCLAIPAGISISGCTRNPAAKYCPATSGYGELITSVNSISMSPATGGISLAFGQTQQASAPTPKTCLGTPASVSSFTYGTTNNQLVDISPTGNICAGTWNRNTGGGIANFTICSKPNPVPVTGSLPYGVAYISASAQGVSSNPVEVFVHAQVTSVTLVGPQSCVSQAAPPVQLDAQACFAGSNNTQQLLCAPPSVTHFACPLPPGVASVPDCSSAIGTLSYSVATPSIASINSETNQITAELPGTTIITASIAGSGSSAGYFSTCPPASINVTLANGSTSGTVTQGVTQDLTTTVIDSQGNPMTGISLTYQSTDPIDITAGNNGNITTNYPGVASITAICQPSVCNPGPINEIGLYGTALPVSSNPVTITVPGTASDYVWFGAPGQSRYFTQIELLNGTPGTSVLLPYVPNSMVMDRLGTNLYFGSSHELMIYATNSNSISKQDTNAPGVVLAVSPNNGLLLINDQVRKVFYVYSPAGGTSSTFGGMGTAAQWTPDSQTLYITDSVAAGPGHTDTLYVYNFNTGWTTTDLSATGGATDLAITIPGVGAYLSGNPTVAHTWCPAGNVGNYASMQFYPQGDLVNTDTNALAATTDGKHILGAAVFGGGATLSDIGITIPTNTPAGGSPSPIPCPDSSGGVLSPLTISHTLNQLPLSKVNATAINQVVAAPSPGLAFVTYNSSTPGALLPYYLPGSNGAAGTVGYVPLTGANSITAPVAGAFSPDGTYFFVSTAGDNLVHYITIPNKITSTAVPTDSQTTAPNLPACTPVSAGGNDLGCTYTGTGTVVPATVITVKPRSTT